MARGNQREKSRQANDKKREAEAKSKGNGLSGSQMQHNKEANADIMRQKQAACTPPSSRRLLIPVPDDITPYTIL
ncbi:hypothetical protein FZEAL_2192 [Fusarium zealandicum]|uniref:Small EDRK-rich factor-like N-terminal domain-containing protein n=1 Tax=Fusarium zealandicum TaxID=1053134 RepID=A0A8H4URX8_9HYPO|nr:hypothetical protein FZEAL_2192 [Fusarium zealandicum]